MRDFATKADNVGDTLGATGFNAYIAELERIATDAGFTLDPEVGPDTDLDMLGKSMAMYASGAQYYADSGIANAYVLSRVGNLQPVRAYFDGMTIIFITSNASTGASTVNVSTLGAKNIVNDDGTPVKAGDINKYVQAIYRLSTNRFEIIKPTVEAKFYTDSGAADAYVLSPVAPRVAPTAYYDGMMITFVPDNTNTGVSTVDVGGLGAKSIRNDEATALAGDIMAGEFVSAIYVLSTGRFEITSNQKSGSQVGYASVQDGATDTGPTAIPADGTIPQITEGDEYMTLAYTPKKATNKLKIDVVVNGSHSSIITFLTVALFQDALPDALAQGYLGKANLADSAGNCVFSHTMVAGSTAARTYRVRMGSSNGATTKFNGNGGGVMASSITVTEIEV